jgi:hypothetical protein
MYREAGLPLRPYQRQQGWLSRATRPATARAQPRGEAEATEAVARLLGRVPEDELLAQLRQRSGLTALAAGDSSSPRGLEEAILEGTLAAPPGL